jgi:hypothetical protein
MSNEERWNPTPPGWTPTAAVVPKPRVLLFEFTRGEDRFRCEMLEHGEFGAEAQFMKNGELLIGKTFETWMLAALWADEQRKAIEKGGA